MCHIESLLCGLDFEPQPIITAAGLSPEDLYDPNHLLPYAKAAHLLAHCAEASQCDHFGLLLGQRFLLAQLGIAGQLASTAADVASALHDIVSDFPLHDQGRHCHARQGIALLRVWLHHHRPPGGCIGAGV